jgi:hypothetical protein
VNNICSKKKQIREEKCQTQQDVISISNSKPNKFINTDEYSCPKTFKQQNFNRYNDRP